MDLASISGTALGLLVILLGQWFAGGALGQILQASAAFIVLGGTLAAVLLSSAPQDLKRAFSLLPSLYSRKTSSFEPLIQEAVNLATVVRKEGLLAIEGQKIAIQDPILRKGIKYIVEGLEPASLREILDSEIKNDSDSDENAARVFEAAGTYAPTLGIVGAVLGLIQVVTLLSDPAKLGQGIAVAFVSALYGLALANLLFLPWAAKTRRMAEERAVSREIAKLGVFGIVEGVNPHFLQERLQVFLKKQA